MATWNTDNPKTTNQILEDVADIEENLQELHDVIQAITTGTLGTTEPAAFTVDVVVAASINDGTNDISFPTNNSGAAVFMVGDNGAGNNTMWMYLNAAPTGWKVSTTGGDSVLAISGGSGDYNVNGGNPDSAASWEVDGFTVAAEAAHTHTAANHVHQWYQHNASAHHESYASNGSEQTMAASEVAYTGIKVSSGTDNVMNADQYTSSAGAAATGAGSSHTHGFSHDSSWRPSASVGKLFDLDTA